MKINKNLILSGVVAVGLIGGAGLAIDGNNKAKEADQWLVKAEKLDDRVTQAKEKNEEVVKTIPSVYAQIDDLSEKLISAQKTMVNTAWKDGYYHRDKVKDPTYIDARDTFSNLIDTAPSELKENVWYNEPTWNMQLLRNTTIKADATAISYVWTDKDGKFVQLVSANYSPMTEQLSDVKLYRTTEGSFVYDTNAMKTYESDITGEVNTDLAEEVKENDRKEKEAKEKANDNSNKSDEDSSTDKADKSSNSDE